ncbi:hypothetical protein B0H13DRAFT_2310680 [Mycena leptocephala]|nr:hypothetical protein B0H13DRAFT_2310680 [Mycena leptocephala]
MAWAFCLCTLLLIASVGTNAQQQSLVINTPTNVTQCGVTNVTWSGGLREYFKPFLASPLTVKFDSSTLHRGNLFPIFNSLDSTMPAGGNLAAGTPNTSLLWTVAEPAVLDFGTSTAVSNRIVVQPSNNTSCLESPE